MIARQALGAGALGLVLLFAPGAAADDLVVRTELPLKAPRSRDPVLGGARDKVFFQIWLPSGVKTVRGAVCNPFSRDEAVSKHWQAACRHWQFAYLQTDFDGVKKEEFALLPKALAELAKKSGRPEVEHLPFCWIGMSRGGMSMQLSELLPDRTIASAPVCLEVGPATAATRRLPVLTVFGEKDGAQMAKLLEKLPKEREQHARWALAVQWGRRHEFGRANNLAFVFFDDAIARRLPKETPSAGPVTLRDIPEEDGLLADVASWNKDGRRPEVLPWKDFPGDRGRSCWFPSLRVAAVWQAFVSGRKDVVITEPAGLGDGQAFVPHPAGRPILVKLTLSPKLQPASVGLWDGDQKLAERTAAPWEFAVNLRAGIHPLTAVVRDAGAGVRTSWPHTIVVAQ